MLSKLLPILFFIFSNIVPQEKADSIFSNLEVQIDSNNITTLLDEAWNLRSNDPLSAMQIAKYALELSVEIDDKKAQSKSLNYLGIIYSNLGANDIALDHHKAALKVAEEADDKVQIAYSYNNIGGIYGFKNDLTQAIDNIQKAIKIFEEIKNKTGLAYCSINIGKLYRNQENYDKSLKYFKRALDIASEIEIEDMKARVLLDIANVQFIKGEYRDAKTAYLELENYYQEVNYLKGLAETWNKLGEVFHKKKKYKTALDYSLKAQSLNKKILYAEGEVANLNNIALIYQSLGNISKGEKYLTEARNKSANVNDPYSILDMYKTHYEFYKETGNLKKSIQYFEKYHQLKDSVFTNEEVIKLGELESLLRIEKAENEKAVLQKELEIQKNQRNYFLVILVLLIIIAAIITYRFYEKKRLSEQLKQTNLVKDKFFRIIAHDLREPFSAILGSIDIFKDSYDELSKDERIKLIDTIQKAVKKDYELLENLLIWSRSHSNDIIFKPIKLNLKNIIENNLSLIKGNFTRKNISVEINCKDNCTLTADEQMLNSILRNLIFNAVKFTRLNGKITIDVIQKTNSVKITVNDNGLGMDQFTIDNLFRLDKKVLTRGTAGESGSGIGLLLAKEFVEKHGGTISVESSLNAGSTFNVELPKISSQ
ncbi:MAG: tetratricopeptide repeat protein [Ignavibacteriae bacterium]|nr:hypothetical protein [Ignavibacteriota bacterium]NOH00022.1 tetratricopeptide repeat protein [Ignavibacteriota bacterium]